MRLLNTKVGWIFLAVFSAALTFTVSLVSSVLRNISFGEVPQAANASNTQEVAEDTTPKYFYFNKGGAVAPKISADAYLVGDLDTGEIIMAKNQDQVFPIASVTKLMTALVSREIHPSDNLAKVSKSALATYGGNGGFRLGEQIKTSSLLYPLLLESSNDAAEILAEFSDRDIFIQKMNQQAQILEMNNTRYEDPSGLSPNNKSTPSDLFKLAGYLKKVKQDILFITTKRSFTYKEHNWSSSNQFLKEEGYLGGKSGYTDPAGQTVISMFSVPLSESGTRPVGIVLLRSEDRYKDVKNILKFLKKNIYYGGVADANTAWVKQKDGIPEIRDPDFVTLALLGDIMLDRGVKNSVIKNHAGDYAALFEKPKEMSEILKKSDIVFANLEGPASDKGKDLGNLYSFRMDPSVLPALKGAGISVLSVANNHVGDYGSEAFVDTLARLKENELLYTGGGLNKAEAEEPVVIEKYGMKIGFLAFSDKGPEYLRTTADSAGILLANNPRFDEIIQNAKSEVDYLVVSFHFGEEYKTKHDARQEYLAHKAIDAGAKVVIGAHPHVIQDTEVYKDGFIAYSLGNFIFDQQFSKDTMQGMLLELKLNRDGSMSTTQNIIKLNKSFQPETIVKGKEEKVKFGELKTQ